MQHTADYRTHLTHNDVDANSSPRLAVRNRFVLDEPVAVEEVTEADPVSVMFTGSGLVNQQAQNGSPRVVFRNNFVSGNGAISIHEEGSSSTHSGVDPTSPVVGVGFNREDHPGHFVFATPEGTQYWIPNVSPKFIPVIGHTFPTFEAALDMYQDYAEQAGFSVKKGQTKCWLGIPTHKYLRCSKYGKPQFKKTFDTLDASSIKPRKSSFTLSNCKAHILFTISPDGLVFTVNKFNDIHNHELVDTNNRDLTKISRKLSYATKQFIHNMSINRIGPVKSHRCLVVLKGGHHNVNGTVDDFKNFSQKIRIYIGERDAQLFLDRLQDRFNNLPDFFYDFVVSNGQLKSVFWVDEISKLNYKAFGDVLAFDATYQTNKYNMIFVPFTGVDHHKQCVTFGAGLLSNETIESYVWLLQSFLKAHGSEPRLVLSDQDPSMLQAVPQVFGSARHRLCMWHIMKKLPSKVSGDKFHNNNLRQNLHRLVWNIYIKPSTFESRWHDLLDSHGLMDNQWLNDMYAILELVTECVDAARSDESSLNSLVDQLRSIKIKLLTKESIAVADADAEISEVESIMGQPLVCDVVVGNREVANNKGCGKHRRITGPGEIASSRPPKLPKAPRLCNKCRKYVTDHDSRNCDKVAAMKQAKERNVTSHNGQVPSAT